MSDLERALADVAAIRMQIARQTRYFGLGSGALAATGGLALFVGFAQAFWLGDTVVEPGPFFAAWIALAVVSTGVIAFETLRRARLEHRGLSDEMMIHAVEGFVPIGGAGACLGLVFARFAPDQVWMLPGLWQMLVGLGIFASLRILPRQASLVGAFYVVAGLAVLALASDGHRLSPCLMALPFAIGQGWLAIVMHRYAGGGRV